MRLNLYSRLQRFETGAEVDAFADELEDRFGPPPPETTLLIDLARFEDRSQQASGLPGSPRAQTASRWVRRPPIPPIRRFGKRPDCIRRNDRLIFKIATQSEPERLSVVRELVDGLQRASALMLVVNAARCVEQSALLQIADPLSVAIGLSQFRSGKPILLLLALPWRAEAVAGTPPGQRTRPIFNVCHRKRRSPRERRPRFGSRQSLNFFINVSRLGLRYQIDRQPGYP